MRAGAQAMDKLRKLEGADPIEAAKQALANEVKRAEIRRNQQRGGGRGGRGGSKGDDKTPPGTVSSATPGSASSASPGAASSASPGSASSASSGAVPPISIVSPAEQSEQVQALLRQISAQKAELAQQRARLNDEIAAHKARVVADQDALTAQKEELSVRQELFVKEKNAAPGASAFAAAPASAFATAGDSALGAAAVSASAAGAASAAGDSASAELAGRLRDVEAREAAVAERELAVQKDKDRVDALLREAEMERQGALIRKEEVERAEKDLQRRVAAAADLLAREESLTRREAEVAALLKDFAVRQAEVEKKDAEFTQREADLVAEQVRLRRLSAELSTRTDSLSAGIFVYEDQPEDLLTTLSLLSQMAGHMRDLVTDTLIAQVEESDQLDRPKLPRRILEVLHEISLNNRVMKLWMLLVFQQALLAQPEVGDKAWAWYQALGPADERKLKAEKVKYDKQEARFEALNRGDNPDNPDGDDDDQDDDG
jgi:hypothetical protein